MKYALSLTLLAASCSAMALDRGQSGLWFNPDQPGHGFEITAVTPDTASVAWYTFDPDGKPIWVSGLLTEGPAGVLSGDVSYIEGMRFGEFDDAASEVHPWGTLRVTFSSCNNATLAYDGTMLHDGEAYGEGEFPLLKLAGVQGVGCGVPAAPPSLAGGYVGFLSIPSTGGGADLYTIIEPDGEATIIAPAVAAYFGTVAQTATAANFTLTGFAATGLKFSNGNTVQPTTAATTYRASDFINGTTVSDRPGLISMTHFAAASRPAPFSTLAGTYRDVTPRTGFVWTVSATGQVTGTGNGGCKYTGTLTPLTSLNAAFDVSMTITGCASGNGTFGGKALVTDWTLYGDQKGLALAIKRDNDSIPVALRRD